MGIVQKVTHSEQETAEFARGLAAKLRPGDVLLLTGPLGAGKTAFIRGIVGYFDTGVLVTSPTFTLLNVYPTKPPLYHFDLYRISGENDLLDLGFEDYLAGDGIVLVEWAEKYAGATQHNAIMITIDFEGPSSRRITIRSDRNDGIGG